MAIQKWEPLRIKLPNVYAKLKPVCHPQQLLKLSGDKNYREKFLTFFGELFSQCCHDNGIKKKDFETMTFDVLRTGNVYQWKEQFGGKFLDDLEAELERKIESISANGLYKCYSLDTLQKEQEDDSIQTKKLRKMLVEAVAEPIPMRTLELSQLSDSELREKGCELEDIAKIKKITSETSKTWRSKLSL